MSTIETGSNSSNAVVYAMTLLGTFVTDNWYLIIMVLFGLVHVFIAIVRNKREDELHKAKLAKIEVSDE